MGLINYIFDGWGKGHRLRIYPEGQIGVVNHQHPPQDETVIAQPFVEFFTDSAGSSDMTVDGSTTAVEFSIDADPEEDVYVKFISVNIGDGGSPALNKFGALSALTNGVEWCWVTQDLGNTVLEASIKTNLEFIRIAPATAGVGDSTTAFLADTRGGGTEKNYLPQIDLQLLFGGEWGLRLRKGTTDKMVFKVQDDLSGLTTFDIKATGRRLNGST